MTQEEKQLLLKDLCARLPYGIKFKADNEEYIREIHYIKDENVYIREYQNLPYWIDTIKPYLRPMSSMTKKERQFLLKFGTVGMDENDKVFDVYPFGLERTMFVIDFLNTYHFDYRGLIPMGLAIEAPEEMYNNKS